MDCNFPCGRNEKSSSISGNFSVNVERLYGYLKKEGVRSLYDRLTPRVMRTIPAAAVLFLVYYEHSKKFMLEYL